MKNMFFSSADQLCFNKVDLSSTVALYPTPFYIYATEEFRNNCRDVLAVADNKRQALSSNHILSRMIVEYLINGSRI